MSVRTKIRRIKNRRFSSTRKRQKREDFIPWREVYKKEIGAFSEGGLMLRGSRHKVGVTQQALAGALGISQHHISEMENGKRPIGKEMAKRLAEYFETDYRIFL